MDLKELGSRLKNERERQGLTIEQIMEITKVSRVNINAIESGNQKEFPHEVYAKGFVKTYAKALGLDAEEVGEEFSQIMRTGTADAEDVVDGSVQPDYGPGPKKSPAGTIFLVLILVGIVGGLVYYLHDNSYFSAQKVPQTEVVVEEAVQEKPAVPEQNKAPVVEEKQAEPAPAEAVQPAANEEPIENKVEEAAETVEQPIVEETVAVVEPVGNIVAITAKPGEACWLEAVIDGDGKEYVIQEGDTLTFPYKDSLKIKLGNGGGVEILSNGKPFEFDAPKGKVKKLDFPAAR